MRLAAFILLAKIALVGSSEIIETNWSQTIPFQAKALVKPDSLDQLKQVVQGAPGHVKVIGTGHSFTDIADTDGAHVSLENFQSIEVDKSEMRVTFGAGTTYTKLLEKLSQHDVTLYTLPTLPHLNVVGSIVTASHGSGFNRKALAGYVTKIFLVDQNGEEVALEKGDENFQNYLHSFGQLGIIYKAQVEIRPALDVSKCIYTNVPWSILQDEGLDNISSRHESISFFTDFRQQSFTSVWLTTQLDSEADIHKTYEQLCEPDYLGGSLIEKTHPVLDHSSEPCVGSGPGKWSEKIFHFVPWLPPSSAGDEIQSEYFVEHKDFNAAIQNLYASAHLWSHVLRISEIRPIMEDDISLSPYKGRRSYGFHFTWKREPEQVYHAIQVIQKVLAPFNYRVHWGKNFINEPNFQKTFEDDLNQLKELIGLQDSEKFLNCYTERLVFNKQQCDTVSVYGDWLLQMKNKTQSKIYEL